MDGCTCPRSGCWETPSSCARPSPHPPTPSPLGWRGGAEFESLVALRGNVGGWRRGPGGPLLLRRRRRIRGRRTVNQEGGEFVFVDGFDAEFLGFGEFGAGFGAHH